MQLKRNLLSVALASATMMLATSAWAQTTPAQPEPQTDEDAQEAQDQQAAQPQEIDRVTITGIRAGIEKAIDTKRNSTSIVEAGVVAAGVDRRDEAAEVSPRGVSA